MRPASPGVVKSMVADYGSQAIVASIDVGGDGISFASCGRWATGVDLTSHAQYCVSTLGVGELFLNSLTHDGMGGGYDFDHFDLIRQAVDVPVIYMGGAWGAEDMRKGIEAGASGVGMANRCHYVEGMVRKVKRELLEAGVNVRPLHG